MKEVSLFEAKTHLSGLINDVVNSQGQVAVTKHGHPVVVISPICRDLAKLSKEDAIKLILSPLGKPGKDSIQEILEMRDEGRRFYP